MSGIPQSRKLWITPLSPVHMGTDEDYTPTGYVIEGNALYEFDHRALENLPESERHALDKLLAGKARPEMLKNVQAYFQKNREWLIPAAINVVHVSDGLAALYRARVGKAANIETSGRQVLNALEIERAAYNPKDRRLYLPGSGLKGAIRTALLDEQNGGNRPVPGERNKDLQQRLFHYTMRELHKDPMRLVQVGDCHWEGEATLNSAEILFAVNRKKQPVVKDGREISSQAEQRNLYQMLECAAPFRFRAFRGSLSIADTSVAGDSDHRLPTRQFAFSEIAEACNRFYRPIFERENELLKKRGFVHSEWHETVSALLTDPVVKGRLDNNDAFLLRVGRHSGAESVTLNGVRSIRIMQGRGQQAKWEPEAKTLWLATGDQQDKRYLRPFGWLLVEMTAIDDEPPEWPKAKELIEHYNQAMGQWLQQVQEKRAKLEARVSEARENAARKEKEAAEEARLEAERQRRLAEMSEEERLMDALRNQLEQDRKANRKEAGGELNHKRVALLDAALEWTNPDLRRQAAELIEETARFLPWAKKRKKEVREKLQQLRNPG